MKRFIMVVLVAAGVVSAATFGQTTKPVSSVPTTASAPVKLRVLCSTFPIYLFTKNVTEGRAGIQVKLMIASTTGCPHDYLLTPLDLRKVATCNVFIANGLGLEEFLGNPLRKVNDNLITIDTSAGIGNLIELTGEHEAENEMATAGRSAVRGEKTVSYNPHLFASPKQAAAIVKNIAAGLSKIDPAGAAIYVRNAEAYAKRLEKLANEFVEAVKTLPSRKIVTEHAVFDYLARDCGLEVVAVVEENPGQEPSAAMMIELVKKIKSSGAAAVLTEPQYPAKVAQTIAAEANVPTATLDPVASGPADAPNDYYEKVMEQNIQTLKSVLQSKDK